MNRFKPLPILLGACLLFSSGLRPAAAQQSLPAPPEVQAAPSIEPAMDPVMRALLLALAARMLTEAARSPDPMEALGASMERALASALRSPATARMLEGLMGHALKDVPPELREPLGQFAGSMLESMRRDMLEQRAPRARY